MNKYDLQQIILQRLEMNHQVAVDATQRAIDAATDEETVPEHKYDTLALEASYLAHGQALRVQECEDDIRTFRELVLREFDDKSAIGMSALVQLIDEDDQARWFFIGPTSGGLIVECQGNRVAVLTPHAPLGALLNKKQVGDEIELTIGSKSVSYEIAQVS
ncbi:GreA/GreB family elongation factor [Vibrio genomosp. F6]|uniref:GreA/GreB family elongation factor n=1 Tax=Vibrio TaxID=662 RepID=UPI0010BDAECC|nr:MULTISPECIES: GreA/GreB family elongation factor [Vibrio]MDN3698871.1 transcription elongation factor [Vibrio cortegadensis]NOH83047.1 GreA/GreB family elongation factor [Vibrio sp. 03-59-1]TKF20535.1 GreA/GreB family elongation factor [Vibrio genomosp. F6]